MQSEDNQAEECLMPIMNYTTKVKCEKTAAGIQNSLRKAGAKSVLTEYLDDGRIDFISFRINTSYGSIFFKLPARVDGVYRAMQADGEVPRRHKTKTQAERVAWRIIKDWVECQIALVDSEQAELEQVFLPYAQKADGQTLYESIKNSGFKALTHEN